MNQFIGPFKSYSALIVSQLFLAVPVLIGFWILAKVSERLILILAVKTRQQEDLAALLAKTCGISLSLLGLVTALGTLGVNVSAIVASLGLTGFALGFALKDALANLLAGVMILMYRPFIRGDRISVTGLEGKVVKIDLRYTILQSEQTKVLIPNSNLFTNPVIILQKTNVEAPSENKARVA